MGYDQLDQLDSSSIEDYQSFINCCHCNQRYTIMSNLSNSFDYNVKLLGLLSMRFDFAKEENIGVRWQTEKLRKVKKPSEGYHEGEMVSDAQLLLENSAVAEAKIIRNNKLTNASNRKDLRPEEVEETPDAPDAKLKTKDDDGQDGIASVNKSVQKLKIKDSQQEGDAEREGGNNQATDKQLDDESKENDENSDSETEVDESTKTESESVDKTMNEDHSAKFLYKCYYNVDGQKPDFLTYRLPLMFLAIKHDPYFFKVNKIRFKPHGCDDEMEFIQMQWPIQLDELYDNPKCDPSTHKGWSGPMFNQWVTAKKSERKANPGVSSASPSETSHGDDDGDVDSAADSGTSYHRAYIQAELKPKCGGNGHGFSHPARGFNILITALIGGVWDLEADPINYTCEHLAEMRTVQEETIRESRSSRHSSQSNYFFYERIRMLSNYWQCYLAGERHYLVGINGPISGGDEPTDEETMKRRQIKELRLYDVSKIPDFIRQLGANKGFRPWSKEGLHNRLYKSLDVIYDTVKDAPIDTEFMFVKYNQFDPPVHDVDGSITGPYQLAFKQLIIEGLPTPSQPKLVTKLMVLISYGKIVEIVLDRKFKREDVPKQENKGDCIVLTFESEFHRGLFLDRTGRMLRYMKENNKFPADCGMENLNVRKVVMEKPQPPRGNNSQSWRRSNNHQQHTTLNNNRWQTSEFADGTRQSWGSSSDHNAQSSSPNYENEWRRGDSAGGNFQSWRSSNQQQQQQQHRQQQSNFRNNNWREGGGSASFREQSRNMDGNRRHRYGEQANEEQNWRRK